jgi:hypothetical protein
MPYTDPEDLKRFDSSNHALTPSHTNPLKPLTHAPI